MGAISSNGTANMSCNTNARRSAGSSVSSTTSSARPTESASTTASPGSTVSTVSRVTTGSGTRGSSASSRRVRRERSMLRHTRAVTVVSHPSRLSMPVASGSVHLQPGLLKRVVCVARRAEHPIRDGAQPRPLLLEPLDDEVVLIHRSHDPADGSDVTANAREVVQPIRDRVRMAHVGRRLRNRADRMLGLELRGLAGSRVPHPHPEAGVVRLLRVDVRHRRAEQHLLSAANRADGGDMGLGCSRRVCVRVEARSVRDAPDEAARRGIVAAQARRPARAPR